MFREQNHKRWANAHKLLAPALDYMHAMRKDVTKIIWYYDTARFVRHFLCASFLSYVALR